METEIVLVLTNVLRVEFRFAARTGEFPEPPALGIAAIVVEEGVGR
ncbi:MAG: hypothetical protein P4M07_19320 [Xanthobacteraceae bacterium]|nr:hypothetical protein [Xanthobacteraceae bacterium]